MKAIAVFQNRVQGHVHFRETPKGNVVVTGTLHGLSPGDHGFHVHTYGNLLDKNCEDCGGHWNVRKSVHGGLNADPSHTGDLGNIRANRSGTALVKLVSRKMKLKGTKSIIGRSLVVHADPDDLGQGCAPDSLSTGNSGARLDCAVIGYAK